MLKEEEQVKRRIGGVAGISDISNMDMEIDPSTNIISGDFKQIKLTLALGFSLPFQTEDGKGTYMATSDAFETQDGHILSGNKSFPSFLQNNYINALDDGPIKVGVALDLDNWGTEYVAEHFPDSKMQARDLVSLAKQGLLGAEIVVHENDSLASAGKAFYASVIATAVGHGKTCYISPYFCFGEYKSLGIDSTMKQPSGELSSLQKTSMIPVVSSSYDYKTGNLQFDKSKLQAAALRAESVMLAIGSATGRCCRVRLFAIDLEAAKRALNTATIEDSFQETNGIITYSGGNDIQSTNRTYSGDLDQRICQYAKACQEVLSASAALYSQKRSLPQPLEKANTTELLKQHARASNLKYAPGGLGECVAEAAPAELKGKRIFPVCDCSLFVTWVLTEAGLINVGSGCSAGDYHSGNVPLKAGYTLKKLTTPEPGCIVAWTSPHNHTAVVISSTEIADFGGTKWWEDAIPNNEHLPTSATDTSNTVAVNRKTWKGRVSADSEGKLTLLPTPQKLSNKWTAIWKIIEN